MDDFGSTAEAVTFCYTHLAIRSNAKGLIFEQLNAFELGRNVFAQILRLLPESHVDNF